MSVGAGQREVLGQNIFEPFMWCDDGGKRVEAIVDPNWIIDGSPRVIRHMAWRPCMCCRRRFFSLDVARVRMCGSCKESPIDKS
jgi:hypothetical protein